MKKLRIVSLLVLAALVFSLVLPCAPIASADDIDTGWQVSNGMNFRKTAEENSDGSYTITLEAYATGSQVITEVTEDIPTDIVLVLDQSGSMGERMNTYGFRTYSNRNNNYFYERSHNGGSSNLYYQMSDGGYASVSVSLVSGGTYNSINNYTNRNYYDNRNNLYALVSGEYQKISVEREGHLLSADKYTYTLPNGTRIAYSTNDGGHPTFSNIDGTSLYLLFNVDQSKNAYTYTFTDSQGTHTIGTSTGYNTQPTDFTLYERYNTGTVTRLDALKSAVYSFATSVANKAKGEDLIAGTEDDINHRIAVVGFASNNVYYNNQGYENTEVFVGATQYRYNNGASGQYGNAFQSMNTTVGVNNISDSIDALTANGGTFTNLGMEMASGILNANPVPAGQKRNRVVIVFTDGIPGASGYDSSVANSAISYGNTIKNSGTTVYTIGIFEGADAGSAGSSTGNNEEARANWFMQQLSSGGGTPNSGYYLSANDAGVLNDIFQQIAHNIETGGTTATLTEDAVIRDVIAPAFTLPDNFVASNIILETWACSGVDSNNDYTWTKNSGAMGAVATISSTGSEDITTDNQVSITGFDFADNYVGTVDNNGTITYRGNKLVIKFNVVVRDGFLGGNVVTTNTSAGIYENGTADDPILTFSQPTVDVPIVDISVNVPDKNVYVLGSLSDVQLKEGIKVFYNGVEFNLGEENYGIEDWQDEYVEVSVTYSDGQDSFTELSDLKADVSYTATVSITPNSGGASLPKTGTGNGKINVFKPVVNFKDEDVYYGGTAPTSFAPNGDVQWKHGDTLSTDENVTMIGDAPDVNFTYTPEEGKIVDGKINTKNDIPVTVTVNIGNTPIGEYTGFNHLNCNAVCTWDNVGSNDGNPAFLLHVNTCTLTITKTGGADGEPYVFTVMKDGAKYTEATITGNGSVTIYELPVGSYTIVEDTGWSWRYNNSISGIVTLGSGATTGTVTCTNTLGSQYWLNGYSTVATNTYDGIN